MASQNQSVNCPCPRVIELELCYAELVEQSREARALRGKLEEKEKSFTAVKNENRRLRFQLLQATSEIQRFKSEVQFLREEMKHMTETHRLALDRVKASRDEDAANVQEDAPGTACAHSHAAGGVRRAQHAPMARPASSRRRAQHAPMAT